MQKRDEFSLPVKRLLAARAGYHCSNPQCRNLTSGPDEGDGGSINMGVAAHITAAAKGGSRYNPNLTSEQRSSTDNGIWLCVHCSVLIDKKEGDFPAELLVNWKKHAENSARKGLEKPGTFASGESNAYTVGCVYRYTKPSKYFHLNSVPTPKGYQFREKITLKPLHGSNPTPIVDATVPVMLNGSLGPTKNSSIFVLCVQNQGTGVERFARISLRLKGAPIWKVELSSEDRLTPMSRIENGTTSGVGGFSVANLMPGEVFSANIYSYSPGPFNTEMYLESLAETAAPRVFDVKFGKPKLVKSPPENPGFENEQYPFK